MQLIAKFAKFAKPWKYIILSPFWLGESGESSQNSLANAGEPSKSRIFPKKAILQVLIKNLNFFFALAKFTCYTSSHWLNKP